MLAVYLSFLPNYQAHLKIFRFLKNVNQRQGGVWANAVSNINQSGRESSLENIQKANSLAGLKLHMPDSIIIV